MPTYPIGLPSSPSFTSMSWNAHSAVAVSTSKFSGKEVVYAHAGQYWEVEFDLPPLNASQSAQFAGAFLSLNGREGTFHVYPSETQPQSPITGTKLLRSVSDYEMAQDHSLLVIGLHLVVKVGFIELQLLLQQQ